VIDEGELRARFPQIPWDQPVEVHILGKGPIEIKKLGERTLIAMGNTDYHWVCRYCIAMHGLKAQDIMQGRTPEFVYETRAEALTHVEAVHHD
jgi:hypothetical protein